MDAEYLTGIDEIDAQHREIDEVANAVVDAVRAGNRWPTVHYDIVRLYELLRIHFLVEESVMRIVAFPEVDEHKKVHQEILDMVARMKVATLDPHAGPGDEAFIRQFSFLTHIIDHDKRLTDFIATQHGGLRR